MSKSPCILLNKNINFNKNEMESKMERRTLCFRSYKERKLKVKLWWVGSRYRKKGEFFVPFILPEENFFKICFTSMYSVLNALLDYIYFYISKKHYFIHFSCLLLKSSEAFSASLIRNYCALCFLNVKFIKFVYTLFR